jgi:hypothetical protein
MGKKSEKNSVKLIVFSTDLKGLSTFTSFTDLATFPDFTDSFYRFHGYKIRILQLYSC